MLKPRYYLTIVLLPFLFAGCRQTGNKRAVVSATASSGNLQVDSLIKKGHTMKYDSKDVLPNLSKQLDSVSRAQNNKDGLIYASVFKGYAYWFATDYARGMKVSLKALADADKWKTRKAVPEIYSIMANMHKENGNYTEAFKDCIKGLQEARANKDTSFIISLLGLRAMFTHGYYRKKGRPQDDHTSLALQFEALHIAEAEPRYESMRIRFYNNIAQTYKEEKNYNNALLYANKAIVLANKYEQLRSLTYSYNWLGEAWYYLGDHKKGIAYLDTAIAITRRISMPYREMEIYEAMHWCYMSTKSFEPAIAALNRTNKLRDSLQIAKNEKQISELQLKYELVKKDQQIVSLDSLNNEKSRKLTWIMVGLGFFVVLLGIILYQYYVIHINNRRMRSNNDKLNDAMLKIAHIQSHQVRRPLASILGLMNIIKAQDYYAGKDVLHRMDEAAHDLDKRIRQVIKETEVAEEWDADKPDN